MVSPGPPPVDHDGDGHALLCTDTFLAAHGVRLREVAPALAVVPLGPTDAVDSGDAEGITIAFLSSDTWPERARPFLTAVRQASALRWLHVMSAGVDGPIFDELLGRGVRVTRSAGASAHAMAETVFAFLHGLTRDLRGAPARLAERDFSWHRWRELEDRSIAVVGFGPVGRRVVHLASAYGMRPTVVRRTVHGDEPCPTRTPAEIGDVVAGHDVVVLALPHTPETHQLISREVIGRMRDTTLLVNVARGALVDQAALTEALATGRLGGAGLDVFEVEPPPHDDPLWDLPNVLMTPRNAGAGRRPPGIVVDLFLDNLGAFLRGAPMRHEVTGGAR